MLCQKSSIHELSSLPAKVTPDSVSNAELSNTTSSVISPNQSNTAHIPRARRLSKR